MNALLQTLLVPLVTIVGLIVLTALGTVPATVSVPAILVLAGGHGVAAVTGKLPGTGGK